MLILWHFTFIFEKCPRPQSKDSVFSLFFISKSFVPPHCFCFLFKRGREREREKKNMFWANSLHLLTLNIFKVTIQQSVWLSKKGTTKHFTFLFPSFFYYYYFNISCLCKKSNLGCLLVAQHGISSRRNTFIWYYFISKQQFQNVRLFMLQWDCIVRSLFIFKLMENDWKIYTR